MPKDLIPTKEQFDGLMAWLGASTEDPGDKYETIRQSLVKLFVWNGCWDAEDLADETIDRVMRKVPEIAIDYSGDPALYFYGVARVMLKERRRQKTISSESQMLESRVVITRSQQSDDDEINRKFECLDECIAKLPADSRELILDYYQEEKRAKIDFRRQIAQRMGTDVENLRVRVFRIRASIYKCMEKCLGTIELVQ
ncbi:MAG TPA: sigma-70 family RNA polymerase sigma factor [Pyrinomonadaceae bacterium]